MPGVIAFTVDPNLPDQNRVTKSIAHWHKRTNVRLVPRTNQPNFMTFRPGSGCSSHRRYGGGRLLSGWFAPVHLDCGLGRQDTMTALTNASGGALIGIYIIKSRLADQR